VRRLREDVHIHAPAAEVYDRLVGLDKDHAWLPPAFSDFEAAGGEIAFALTLPMRTERARLAVAADEPPTFVEFSAVDGVGGVVLLSWALNPEGPRDVHLTVEAGYEPLAGLAGWLLEETLHRPVRRQALRDALWRLKLLVEGRR
jgi:hypothetical protein